VANYVQECQVLRELAHFKVELWYLGVVYQVIACTAISDKIGQISSKVAYNDSAFVAVSRYDRLGPYMSLHYLFPAVLALSVMFDHITIKEPHKHDSDQKWSIVIQNVLS